ncbi:ABC transporter permease [Propylenella binzhouense]|uniref:ABC transporter permease n=1 Tax=Propylenella binzhouense TaxID=2555902 RepID=A0A964WTP0_9HYPH|nr:FtsX-like permease family protein [Propylenella binzhouense]MYZ48199.1 ABC transporter permease [Propylenella binzhouense]
MRTLDIKLVRDLKRLWAQALAVALVLACGVATLILATGAYRSLEETRSAYYERYRFADVFASATRAPLSVGDTLRAIPGVAAVETRVMRHVLLDIPGMREPATGMAVSLPAGREPAVNAVFLREGNWPEAGRELEAVINENFAEAHGFEPGSTFQAILNGAKATIRVTGIGLSPEFVYALGPGDMMPDDRRFGVLWMPERALAPLFDLDGAFDSVGLRLLRGASEPDVIDAVDDALSRYGGTGAYGRKDQMSNAFLDGELTQLSAMARIIPPIFLFVSAFLINMILSRLIALEREQIGLLKALGYGRFAVAWHYLKLVILIAAVGIAIGFVAGTWLGRGLTELYSKFYSFPFLIFRWDADIYLVAAGVSLGAAVAGAARAVFSTLALAPAVAMKPPAPPVYRQFLGGALARVPLFSQLTIMGLRHMMRWPVRAATSMLGTSLAVALLIVALFSFDSVAFMLEVMFYQSEREDATLSFASERPPAVVPAVLDLPGVMKAEPFRAVAAIVRHGHLERRLSLTGKPPGADLSRVLDMELAPVVLPETGLAVSDRVASLLDIRLGDLVEVELLEGSRRTAEVPVTAIIQSYIGLMVFMDAGALDRLAGIGPRVSGVHVSVDPARLDALYRAVKETPAVSSIALQTVSRDRFRETMQENMTIMTTIYVTLAVIIAFGVVYNSARIQLSERARELATLRVLGFTRAEVSRVLLTELGVVVLLAQPLGWALGYGFSAAVVSGLASDLFRVPLVVEPATFVKASLVVAGAAIVSALIVRRRIDRFDLVEVLKSRE